jgi:hypothetical protein
MKNFSYCESVENAMYLKCEVATTYKYVCLNPISRTLVLTSFMGEADFWASVGYVILLGVGHAG